MPLNAMEENATKPPGRQEALDLAERVFKFTADADGALPNVLAERLHAAAVSNLTNMVHVQLDASAVDTAQDRNAADRALAEMEVCLELANAFVPSDPEKIALSELVGRVKILRAGLKSLSDPSESVEDADPSREEDASWQQWHESRKKHRELMEDLRLRGGS